MPKSDEPCYTKKSKSGGTYTTCEGAQKKRKARAKLKKGGEKPPMVKKKGKGKPPPKKKKKKVGVDETPEQNTQKAFLKLQSKKISQGFQGNYTGRINTGPLNPGLVSSVSFPVEPASSAGSMAKPQYDIDADLFLQVSSVMTENAKSKYSDIPLSPENAKFWLDEIIGYNWGSGRVELKEPWTERGWIRYYEELWNDKGGEGPKRAAKGEWETYNPSNFGYLTNLATNPNRWDFRGSGWNWDPKIQRFYNVGNDAVIDVDGYRDREGYQPTGEIKSSADYEREWRKWKKEQELKARKEKKAQLQQIAGLFSNVPQAQMDSLSQALGGAYR